MSNSPHAAVFHMIKRDPEGGPVFDVEMTREDARGIDVDHDGLALALDEAQAAVDRR